VSDMSTSPLEEQDGNGAVYSTVVFDRRPSPWCSPELKIKEITKIQYRTISARNNFWLTVSSRPSLSVDPRQNIQTASGLALCLTSEPGRTLAPAAAIVILRLTWPARSGTNC